jgi:hypothetical protein
MWCFIETNVVYENSSEEILIWETVAHKCNYQKNNCDCGVYMLTFSYFLVDLPFESCQRIDCKYLARLKIATDITRGFLEDPRLFNFTGYNAIKAETKCINYKELKTIDLTNDDCADETETEKDLKLVLHQKDIYINALINQQLKTMSLNEDYTNALLDQITQQLKTISIMDQNLKTISILEQQHEQKEFKNMEQEDILQHSILEQIKEKKELNNMELVEDIISIVNKQQQHNESQENKLKSPEKARKIKTVKAVEATTAVSLPPRTKQLPAKFR